MRANLFLHAKQLIQIIQENGHEAYIVGGAVRDSLLRKPVQDIDIATSAFPEEIMQIFTKVIPTGIKHGTVLVRYNQISFEVTTYRTESTYTDFRRPDQVHFVSNLKDDLARRDFTINAMAMDQFFHVTDPFDGKSDLESHIIRTVGDPNKRFSEDPLRIMRAIRFQSQLNFSIEQLTWNAIVLQGEWLENIAVERIQLEWIKMLQGKAIKKAIKTIIQTNIHHYIPIISDHKKARQQLHQLETPFENMQTFIVYMNWHVPEISISTWIKKWKLSNLVKKDSELLLKLIKQYEEEPMEWIVYQLPEQLHKSFQFLVENCTNKILKLEHINSLKKSLPIGHRSELTINGKDITDMFPNLQKGPWIKEKIQLLEKAVVLKQVGNSKSEIREWLRHGEK